MEQVKVFISLDDHDDLEKKINEWLMETSNRVITRTNMAVSDGLVVVAVFYKVTS